MHLPENVQANKMAPKSELMVYIGVAPENKSNLLVMRSSNNVLFTSAHALFDKAHFTRCVKPTCIQPTAQVTSPVAGECEPIRPPLPADDDDINPGHLLLALHLLSLIVSNKTVPITTVHEAHCKHTWEYYLGLV